MFSFTKIPLFLMILFSFMPCAWGTEEVPEPSPSSFKSNFKSTIPSDSLSSDRDPPENNPSFSPADIFSFAKTLGMTKELTSIFQKLFHPSLASEDSPISDEAGAQQARSLLTSSNEFLTSSSRFIDPTSASSYSEFKTSEYQTMIELMLRIGMQQRPHYFSTSEEDPSSQDIHISILKLFLQEFINGGALDTWVILLKTKIREDQEKPPVQKEAFLEFIDFGEWLLKNFLNNDNFFEDLENKYVDSGDINEARHLYRWLQRHQGHTSYDKIHSRFDYFKTKIKIFQDRAHKEGHRYMQNLVQRLAPDMSMPQLTPSPAEPLKTTALMKHLDESLTQKNVFEPHFLRSFWEGVERHQYGKTLYKMVCESFLPELQSNESHQQVQQLWFISQLDTIHAAPREAKSRMPGFSSKGHTAPNFGYQMAHSEEYMTWIKNSWVRTSGDIIMDSFARLVDIGKEINEDEFLARFKIYLHHKEDYYKKPHPYDKFIFPFIFHLLETVFETPFISDGKKNVISELLRVSGDEENLDAVAKRVLADFKLFSTRLFELRAKEKRGPVLGIGFNGPLFESPRSSQNHDNEIWMTFSTGGRKEGGYLFLSFLKELSGSRLSIDHNLEQFPINFARYKHLIKKHLQNQLKQKSSIPDPEWDSHMLKYIQGERKKFHSFLTEIDSDADFLALLPEFKAWLLDNDNWYSLPRDIKIKIAEDIPAQELEAQYATRNLLFDALTERLFSQDHPHLMPLLFRHWKDDLLKTAQDEVKSNITSASTLEDIPEALRTKVTDLLDTIVIQVHPDLRKTWESSIHQKFEKYMKEDYKPPQEVKNADYKLNRANNKVAGLTESVKKLTENNKPVPDETTTVLETAKSLQKEAQAERDQFPARPTKPAELPRKDFEQFRDSFFGTNSEIAHSVLSQCVEPVLARVLGHDHFLPVCISGLKPFTEIQDPLTHRPFQIGNILPQDVIPPCDNRCQYHALGHVYVGDMLTPQSADRLHEMRQTHGLGEVQDQFMPLKKVGAILKKG